MKKEYGIKDVARIFNITTNKIRYYEEKGLIKPVRDENNEYRVFDEDDMMKLQAVLLYRSIGLSIKDIRNMLENGSSKNYLDHFNKQWEIVNDEIHRMVAIRKSLEDIIDGLYESDSCSMNSGVLEVIRKTYELNEIRNNWVDKWNFDSWAQTYDKSVAEDRGALKIYKNYDLMLETVYSSAVNSVAENPCVLEIGVGTGNLASKFLKNKFNIVGVDQSREMLNVAKEKHPQLKVRIGEFLKLPFDDKSFDVIVSTYAFHHLKREEKVVAISEMLRVLKDNGKIVIGDLMFENKEDEESVLKDLSKEQIEEVQDEYYSHVDFLEDQFGRFHKKLKHVKIDEFNHVVEIW